MEATLQLSMLNDSGEPGEVKLRSPAVEMQTANPMQKQLSEITHQMMHIIRAWNTVKVVMDAELEPVHYDLDHFEALTRSVNVKIH